MKDLMTRIALILLIGSASLVSCSVLKNSQDIGDFEGTWISEGESFSLEIRMKGDELVVESTDLGDGERFRVTNERMDGKVLKATFYMPSTDWTTYSEFRLVGKNILEETFTGSGSGSMRYNRK